MAEPTAVILVVDDQEAGRFVKVQTLQRAGFDVHEAANGRDALHLAARLAPDVVVLDVNLPDMSGLEVCRQLRERQGEFRPMQIVQVSNTAITTADRVRGLEHGADVYLTEPLDNEIFVATVRALLRAHRAEQALAEALTRERDARAVAEEASRLKDEFIATLSHELRTPLNALMGWIWQLRHSTLSEDARLRALDSLERNARVQAQLISDLLDLSRISRGKLHLKMQFVNVRTVIEGSVDSVRESIARKHLMLSVEAATGCVVVGDQPRLQQVVTNLLTNAVQFTPERGTIEVTLTCGGGDVVIEVRDTGAGIDPAFLPHVFDQFRQGEGGLSRKHGGLGLGLSVVRQIVDLHGGRVTVSSAGHGHGTTFTVALPAERDLQASRDGDPNALVLSGMTILVSHPAAHDLVAILEASGAHAVPVVSDSAAVDALADHEFDLIVADTMPAVSNRPPVVAVGEITSAAQLVRSVMAARRRPTVRS